jgi:predicted nucleic acid-binding protein
LNVGPTATSGWVVDASVLVKWYLPDEQFLDQADALLAGYLRGQEALASPHFARYELASAVTRAARLGRISQDDALSALSDFAGLQIAQEHDGDARLAAATSWAVQLDVSCYDALYLALAEELGLRLVTADSRFQRRAALQTTAVSHIGDVLLEAPP